MSLQAKFDGCCEPRNPGGHAAYGAVINAEGQTLWKASVYVGSGPAMSNNVAEYCGLAAILRHLLENPELLRQNGNQIRILGDSKLAINQITGAWKAKGGLYFPYLQEAKRLLRELSASGVQVGFGWIPRAENEECDRLSKAALTERGVHLRIQP